MTCFEPMNEPPFCRAGMRTGRESPRDLQPQRRPAGPGPERNEPAGGGRTRGAGWPRRCTRARSATAPAAPTSTDPSRDTRPRSATASGAAKARSEDSSTGPLGGFEHEGCRWPAETGSAFYDWLWTRSALARWGEPLGRAAAALRRVHGPVSRRRRRGLPSEDGRDGRRHGTGESEAGRGESRSVAAGDPAENRPERGGGPPPAANRIYAGIGSRQTPAHVLLEMELINDNYFCRSPTRSGPPCSTTCVKEGRRRRRLALRGGRGAGVRDRHHAGQKACRGGDRRGRDRTKKTGSRRRRAGVHPRSSAEPSEHREDDRPENSKRHAAAGRLKIRGQARRHPARNPR